MDDLKFDVQVDVEVFRRWLGVHQRQIPFAAAYALTKTAEDVRKAEVKHLYEVFTVRSTWWKPNMKYGLRSRRATKQNLQSEVYTSAPWLIDHVKGATRHPLHEHRAVPKSDEIARTKRGSVRAAWKPSRLKGKYEIKLRSGRSLLMSYTKRKGSRVIYYLIPEAKIKPRYDWYGVAALTAKKRWPGNFDRAMRFAIRTAK